MTDKYYRLVTILVNICPGPLRELFLKHAAADPNLQAPYTTLDSYLSFRKKDIMKLKYKKMLRHDQCDLLFPPQGQGQADIKRWDITLLSIMLTELFSYQIQQDKGCINVLKDIRNNLQHISSTCQITDSEFVYMYQQLLSDVLQLALSAKGQGYADQIKQDIESVANCVLTDLGDVLRKWYLTEIMELKDEVKHLKDQMDEIKEDTTQTRKTLKKTTVKRTRAGGKITKRFKTVDHILDNMRGSFSSLMKHERISDFENPPETPRITRELEEHHLVVVSGYGKSLFLQTALSVIDSKEYDEDRCVVVLSPSDWRHIGTDDADLVVFLHPFGKKEFDNEKAKSMIDILDSIKLSTSENDEDEVDVVIVTDQSILEECKKHYSHDVIENPIVIYKPTTEDSPVDLVEGESAVCQIDTDPHYKNLLVQSIAYCRHHRMQLTDNSLKEDALELFRSKKVLVISGPRGSGKTTLALSLLTSYQQGHYLILTEPEDLRYIKFGVTCVVVIEDFGGKYSFEMSVVQKWLRQFDMLYSAVREGKLNVIITCSTDRLHAFTLDTSKHPILDSVLTLQKTDAVKVKQEPSTDGYSGISNSVSTRNEQTVLFSSVKSMNEIKLDHDDGVGILLYNRFQYNAIFCQHPDGSFLFTKIRKLSGVSVIVRFSSDFRYIRQYKTELYEIPLALCCTDTGDVVIASSVGVRLYRITDDTIQLIKSTTNSRKVVQLYFLMNRIYGVTYEGEILIFDKNLNIKNSVKLYSDSFEEIKNTIALGKKYFYNNYNTIVCEDPKQKQLRYLKKEEFELECICAASEDSVFVLGKKGTNDSRILHVNTDMQILSDIPIEAKTFEYSVFNRKKMVFDRINSRLVFAVYKSSSIKIHELYWSRF